MQQNEIFDKTGRNCIILSCRSINYECTVAVENGKLEVSAEGRYLKHENGQPFFWLGDTGWLMPQRLNREEVAFYLDNCSRAGFNVVQVQTLNGVPSMNVYGQYSMTDGFDFSHIDKKEYMVIGTIWIISSVQLKVKVYI